MVTKTQPWGILMTFLGIVVIDLFHPFKKEKYLYFKINYRCVFILFRLNFTNNFSQLWKPDL